MKQHSHHYCLQHHTLEKTHDVQDKLVIYLEMLHPTNEINYISEVCKSKFERCKMFYSILAC